jgi:hypothetical protein
MWLDKGQRNEIYEAIAAAELDPQDFELKQDRARSTSYLRHHRSASEIVIGSARGTYSGTEQVGGGLPRSYDAFVFPELVRCVSDWLEQVRSDVETPDLWAELAKDQEILGPLPAATLENTPFSVAEQLEIAKQLAEIKTHVKQTHALAGDQMQALEERLDYLQDATGRMNRIDWRNAAAGVLLSAIVNAVLPGDATRDVLLMLFRVVGHMFGHPILELPPAS